MSYCLSISSTVICPIVCPSVPLFYVLLSVHLFHCFMSYCLSISSSSNNKTLNAPDNKTYNSGTDGQTIGHITVELMDRQ
jgi:hypothetical protein